MMGLLEDLDAAQAAPGRDYGCSACDALAALDDDREREALRRALAGTLSVRRLLAISRKNNLGIGRAGIIKHRNEAHQ